MNTIGILWLRQIKRQYRSKSRMIGSLAMPLLFLLAFGFGFGPVFAQAGQGNYLQFLVPGMISMSILFASVMSGIEIIWDRQFGFLKETLVAPVPRLEIMIGRTLGGATVAFAQGLLFLFLSMLFGFRIISWTLLPIAILFMILIALFFAALGTAIASLLNDMQGFQLIMNFLIMPIFFLSGALFPLEGVPKAIKVLSTINPLSYGVSGLRSALAGTATGNMFFNLILLGVLAIIMLVIGSKLFSKMQV
ncbi:MAG TPA: ABC transporter permease [archaeon]|jgi:ABC-2 type transport system permease protein|nr:ABC transporter permease [archaeon]